MIYIPPIPELSVYGVVDAGIPNKERICLRPSEEVNLAHFGIFLAIRNSETGGMTPLQDHFFWFGEQLVSPPAWLIVFTGTGERRTITEQEVTVHVYYWNKKHILFDVPNVTIVPVVFRIASIHMIPLLPNPEQVKHLSSK
ncbi:MAG: hypothetical protein DME24_25620 [Verrucomicrobia bacterium]|nr:MAG: hypothetical protein DME24_25620 [Verrucomicrobiota bacterium]